MNMKKLLACISQKMSGMWSSKVMKYHLARELLLVITFFYNTSCASWLVVYYLQARKVYLPILAIDYAWQQTNKFIRMHVDITVIKLNDIIWQPNAMIWSEIWIISLCIKDIALVYSRDDLLDTGEPSYASQPSTRAPSVSRLYRSVGKLTCMLRPCLTRATAIFICTPDQREIMR